MVVQSTYFESSPSCLLFTSFRSSPFRSAPVRASLVVRGRAFLFRFQIFFNFTFRSIAMASCSSWQRDSILRPSERMLSILPQDHGVLAIWVWIPSNVNVKTIFKTIKRPFSPPPPATGLFESIFTVTAHIFAETGLVFFFCYRLGSKSFQRANARQTMPLSQGSQFQIIR